MEQLPKKQGGISRQIHGSDQQLRLYSTLIERLRSQLLQNHDDGYQTRSIGCHDQLGKDTQEKRWKGGELSCEWANDSGALEFDGVCGVCGG
jgi:hypothetical protein